MATSHSHSCCLVKSWNYVGGLPTHSSEKCSQSLSVSSFPLMEFLATGSKLSLCLLLVRSPPPPQMWMSAYRHQSLVTSSVRTQKEATSVPALVDTSYRKMERAAEVTHTHTQTKQSPVVSNSRSHLATHINWVDTCCWGQRAPLLWGEATAFWLWNRFPPEGQ